MVSIKKVCIGLLILCCALLGQQTNTVYSTLFTNVSASIIAPITGSLTNIGQSNHQVVLVFSNAPAHTCSTKTANGQLEFSYDNTNWLVFGSPTDAITTPNTAIWFGSGAFPFVRFNLVSFDTTNCRVSGFYSGILGGALSTQVTGQQPVGQQVNGSLKPVLLGGLSGNDNTTKSTVSVVPICTKTFWTEAASLVASQIIPPAPAGASIKICSLSASAKSGSAAGNVSVQLYEGSVANACAIGQGTLGNYYLAAKSTIALNGGMGPIFSTHSSGGGGVCLTLSDDGSISISLTYAIVDDNP